MGVKLIAKIPLDYPEMSLPEFDIELLKGLTAEHRDELLNLANEEAEANLGLPSIFAVCERLREWLAENNTKGMDDVSMYAQMMRREKEKEKSKVSFFFNVLGKLEMIGHFLRAQRNAIFLKIDRGLEEGTLCLYPSVLATLCALQ